MLLNLHVKNLAIIDEIEVDFSDHLNILTGETGAGKSIIIGSINLALGGKASGDIVRKGADYGLVELVFQLKDPAAAAKIREMDLPVEDDIVILSRKLMKGRSICKVNGENVTTAVLKEIAVLLIDIHGQHEHQSLLYKNKHLDIVDRFAKDKLGGLMKELKEKFEAYQMLKKEWKEAEVPLEERLREISFLEYEIKEIGAAGLKDNEDEELEIMYKRLSNANIITEGISNVYQITGLAPDNISSGLSRAERILAKLGDYDEEIAGFHTQLEDIDNLLNDFNRELSDYLSGVDYDMEKFKEVEERLNLVNGLKSKYGNSLESIGEYYRRAVCRLEHYRDYELYMEELEEKITRAEEELTDLSGRISSVRKRKALVLEKKIKEALQDLNFLDVQFEIAFRRLEHYTAGGQDEAEFCISTNPGQDPAPLGRVASGGELSRIMLAIKSVLAEQDAVDTLIFDEIDVGVSGRTAQKVSEKLSVIARTHQVICITHLPQIASMADVHFVIEKFSKDNITRTQIRKLDQEASEKELARILGGAVITETVLSSAKEMKELAANTKIY